MCCILGSDIQTDALTLRVEAFYHISFYISCWVTWDIGYYVKWVNRSTGLRVFDITACIDRICRACCSLIR